MRYKRPPDSGNTLCTMWIGPGLVVANEEESFYKIEIISGHAIGAHLGILKLYTPYQYTENAIKLFYHRRKASET